MVKDQKKNSAQQSSAKTSISPFDKIILDSLSAHIAILDANGVILETNRAWRNFGMNNAIAGNPDTLNINYLDICDAAGGEAAEVSRKAAQGLRAVIEGKFEEFTMDYPCHAPTRKMWFYMRATRIAGPGPYRVVVCHENITPRLPKKPSS
jgi:hypothetical protein